MTGLWFSQQSVSEVGGGLVCLVEGTTGVASVIRGYQLSPCLIEPMPAGSKMELLFSKAEPISAGGLWDNRVKNGGNSCARANAA